MPIDDRTTNLSYKLPNAANFLTDDVQRLREALTAIDLDMIDRYTKAVVDQFVVGLTNTDLGLQQQVGGVSSSLSALQASVTALTANTPVEHVFTGNGTETVFALSTAATSSASLLVSVDGVVQQQADYTLSSNGLTLTLSEAPPNGSTLRVYALGALGGQVVSKVAITGAISLSAGSTTGVSVALASSNFLSNSTSLMGVLGNVVGTLARNGSGAYTFAPLAAPSSAITIPANTLFVASAVIDKFSQIGIGTNVLIDESRNYEDYPGYEYVITDGAHRIALAIRKDGTIYAPSLYVDRLGAPGGGIDIDSFDASQFNIINAGSVQNPGVGYDEFYIAAWTDALNRLAFGIRPNGTVRVEKGDFGSLVVSSITAPGGSIDLDSVDTPLVNVIDAGSLEKYNVGFDEFYSYAFIDSSERVAWGIKRDGTVFAPKFEIDTLTVGNLLGATGQQSAVHSSQGLFTVEYIGPDPQIFRYFSGSKNKLTTTGKNYAPSMTIEASPRVLFTSTREGSPSYFVMNPDGSEVFPAVARSSLVVWGDSMGADITPARLNSGLAAVGNSNASRLAVNAAVGGSSSIAQALRMGAIPWTAEIVGGSIPASGSVTLANHRTPILTALNAQYPTFISADPMTLGSWVPAGEKGCIVSINNVVGTITESGGVYSFNRTTAGSAVSVTNPVTIKPEQMGNYSLSQLNSFTAILWPFGTHITNDIVVNGSQLAPQIQLNAELQVMSAMVNRLGPLSKQFIFLAEQATFPPHSTETNMQRGAWSNDKVNAFQTLAATYPDNYFNFTPAFANGIASLGIPSFKTWLQNNYPSIYNSATEGWQAQLNTIGAETVTPQEPAAVATITLTGNGGSGVTSAISVNTVCNQQTLWSWGEVNPYLRTRLRVGVTASGGVATALWVREGGIGYVVGDTIRIPVGAVGNTQEITGTVATLRTETIGTVRDSSGSVVVASSYSEWDVANGFLPRCSRRDQVHFNSYGAEYLSLLLAAKINTNGW